MAREGTAATGRITAIIITRNEGGLIGTCLSSLRWVDEIVVVDALSTDRTVEICREAGARVIRQEWRGFSRQKQTALEAATGEWVLWVDADEVVTPALAHEIRAAVAAAPAEDGFYVPRRNYFLGRWLRGAHAHPDYHLRLFRRRAARFTEELVHESVLVDGGTGHLNETLDHFSTTSLQQRIEKVNRYSSLAARQRPGGVGDTRSLLWALVFRPLRHFVYLYLQRGAWRDGVEGFLLVTCFSFEVFLGNAKRWEARDLRRHSQVDVRPERRHEAA